MTTNAQQVKDTMKFFKVSEDKAKKMVEEAIERNKVTHNKGILLSLAIKNGKTLNGGVAV